MSGGKFLFNPLRPYDWSSRTVASQGVQGRLFRDLVADVADYVTAQETLIEDLFWALESVEWGATNEYADELCPKCFGARERGHQGECKIEQAMADAGLHMFGDPGLRKPRPGDFEQLARKFYEQTGLLAPGKDQMFGDEAGREERERVWKSWLKAMETEDDSC